MRLFAPIALTVAVIGFGGLAAAQEKDAPSEKERTPTESAAPVSNVSPELIKKFKERLTNVKFVGQFTVDGMEGQPAKRDEYTIVGVKKLDKGDWWEIKARIKYGNHDLTVPMPMEVKWAGRTPVITIDRLFILGLGTFDARVLIRQNKYSGTWSHVGKVGGHMFGEIVKAAEQETDEKSADDTTERSN